MTTKFLPGDIFIIDSTSTAATIVKFLMQSPTIYHWILGKIVKLFCGKCPKWLIDDVRVYHPGIIVDDDEVIEQQKVVEFETLNAAFLNKPHIVYRNITYTDEQREAIPTVASQDIGQGYDIPLIFGKTLTWLTGIKWFTSVIQAKDKEICVTRVAKWFKEAVGELFGQKTHHIVTTDTIDNWCINHPDEWIVVSNTLE